MNIADIDALIEAEQIRHIYSQTPIFVPVVMLGSLFTIIMLWPVVSPLIAIIWCLWIWLLYGGFWLICRRWKKVQPDDASMKAWARPYVVLAWVATASWGLAGVLFFYENSFVYQSLLFIILIIGAAAITTTSTAYSPTFYPVVLLMFPLALRLALEDDKIYYMLVFSIFLFTVLLFFLHYNSHSFYAFALKQRFINESLVEQLALQKDIAEQANADKSKFLAAASHDLRQPLQAMSLFHGELLQYNNNAKKREQLMNRLGESISSMKDLFKGVLDVSRFEVGVVKAEMKTFCINDLFNDLCHEYNMRAKSEGLSFRSAPCSAIVYTDPVLLRRIVRNLLENSIHYTSSGSILLGCRRKSNALVLQVWDTGIGIAPENLKNIFEKFKQLNNPAKEAVKGIGLGLSVVKQLSAVLGCELSVQSVLGRGSVFSLRIPVADIKNNVIEIKDNLNLSTVLVLDGDKNMLSEMQNMLSSWGCDVLSATDIDTALSVIKSTDKVPDVIISDYQLNHSLSGIQLIKALRLKLKSKFSAIIVSADVSAEINEEVNKNALALLHKPVNPVQLATLLRFLLSSS